MRRLDRPALGGQNGGQKIISYVPQTWKCRWRNVGIVILILASNVLSHWWFNRAEPLTPLPESMIAEAPVLMPVKQEEVGRPLYLLDKASPYVRDTEQFATKVNEVAGDLSIPSEWLMAVMYAESRLNPSIYNGRGSGAVGLIQFMPSTARSLKTNTRALHNMDAVSQMDYVYMYLANVEKRYGPYNDLTDLYLGILYPKARNQDICYTLYAKPSKAYNQNSLLDENRDGRVTVSDIDKYVSRRFPTAYQTNIEVDS